MFYFIHPWVMYVNGSVLLMLQKTSTGKAMLNLPPSGKFWQKYNNRSKFRLQYFSQYPSAHTPRRRAEDSSAASSPLSTPEAAEGDGASSEASSDVSGVSSVARKRLRDKGRRTCRKLLGDTLAKEILHGE